MTIRIPVGVAIAVFSVFLSPLAVVRATGAEKSADVNVTFAKDVAPIFQQKCQGCHRPGTVAPMSLMTYAEVRPWARSIRQRVAARQMPPWHISRNVGIQEFKNDRSLTDEQVTTIVAWVDAGAPLGDPRDLPAPVSFPEGDAWQIGTPDLIVSMPEEFIVPASGPDWMGNHYADLPLDEDRYFKAIETRVTKGGRRVVHHAITNLAPLASPRTRGRRAGPAPEDFGDSESRTVGNAETFLNEYALGKGGEIFPEGTARLLKAGHRISFNMHYHSIGEEIRNRSSVGFVFYPKGYVPKRMITDLTIREMDRLDVPPGKLARSDVYYRLPKPTRIAAFQPHMHIRGKAMCMEAIHLDGRREMLTCVDNFDFNWHMMYEYGEDVAPLLPAGAIVHLIAVHDNTAANRANPDPSLWIGWGGRSYDEMTAAHMGFEFLTDEDYAELVAERQALSSKPHAGN